MRGRRGHDRMVVEFTTTYAFSANHHWCCEFESQSGRGVQHYVIKFVIYLVVFSVHCTPLSSINKTDNHDITEILLKVALNTIKQTTNIIIYVLSYRNKNMDRFGEFCFFSYLSPIFGMLQVFILLYPVTVILTTSCKKR
jgi:competence protein ComGF